MIASSVEQLLKHPPPILYTIATQTFGRRRVLTDKQTRITKYYIVWASQPGKRQCLASNTRQALTQALSKSDFTPILANDLVTIGGKKCADKLQ